MGRIVLITIFIPLVTVGMVLVVMWGMSMAGTSRKGYGQDDGKRIHSHDTCPGNLFLLDSADGEPAVRKSDFGGGKPVGDRSVNHGNPVLTQLSISNRQQVRSW